MGTNKVSTGKQFKNLQAEPISSLNMIKEIKANDNEFAPAYAVA